MGTAVFAGGALGPDLDSYSSTVTRSYGIFGRGLYYLINALSLFVYGITKTSRDEEKDNGHRLLLHTTVSAIVMGLLVLFLTSLGGSIPLFGKEYSIGQIAALCIMAFFLHLGLAGLFTKQIKKAKDTVGPYILMTVSIIITFIVALFLPVDKGYTWLAIVVAGGWFTHILGDTITKAGTPLLWPLKIRGKRWYDITLPAPMRITAGGDFELKYLTPLFYAIIVLSLAAHLWLYFTIK
jgi:membrane-bound metal-dependent hydrolase YbcI (DUF457 family)